MIPYQFLKFSGNKSSLPSLFLQKLSKKLQDLGSEVSFPWDVLTPEETQEVTTTRVTTVHSTAREQVSGSRRSRLCLADSRYLLRRLSPRGGKKPHRLLGCHSHLWEDMIFNRRPFGDREPSAGRRERQGPGFAAPYPRPEAGGLPGPGPGPTGRPFPSRSRRREPPSGFSSAPPPSRGAAGRLPPHPPTASPRGPRPPSARPSRRLPVRPPPPGWKVEAARAHLQVVHASQAELHRAGGERIPPAAAASPLPQAPVTAATSGGGPHRPEAGSHGLGLAARRRARGEPRAAIGQRLPEGAGPRLAAAVWRPEERPEARRRAARVPPPVTWVSK